MMIEEKAIGFDEIKQEIKKNCKTSSAKELVEKITFLNNYENIKTLLQECYEMREFLLGIKDFPSEDYFDCRAFLLPLRIAGTCISQEDMKYFLLSFSTIKAMLDFFSKEDKQEGQDFALRKIYEKVIFNEDVLKECSRIMDTDGEIKESCSSILREIRQKQQKCQNQISRKIQTLLSFSKNNGWTALDEDVTIRNNSLVIPVKSSYKKQMKGILHDTSQTGQTFYIEPEEIVELNFEAKELFLEEQREIHRILLAFSDLLRENLEDILSCYEFLIKIDFIRAKSLYAISIRAGKPDLKPYPALNWFEARHPLLESSLRKKQKNIVPLRISLNEEQRILIISGPNAGGKSVCLKSVALLQYMLQCGLLVPMKETSEVGIFHNIFVSIGDAQSIENDLSTYSSHLVQMKEICEQADKDTIFLIDELGTGTDPSIGGAIAESVLEYLDEVKSWGVVTTHYSNLKRLNLKHKSIINGAMLYDTEKMLPLFILSIGTPGSSFAFEIAQRIGLPTSIIENAKQKVGSSQVSFERELQQIEVEKLALQQENQKMKAYDEELYKIVQKYRHLEEQLSYNKKNILNQARQEAKEILLSANSKIEKTIEAIKTSQAEKEKVKQLKEDIKQNISQITEDIQKEESKNSNFDITYKDDTTLQKNTHLKLVNTPIQEGDYVLFGSEQAVMEVKSINKNKVELINGIISIRTSLDKVKKIDKQNYLRQKTNNKKNANTFVSNPIMNRINELRARYSPQIDLRGERTEEAIKKVAQMLDTARLLGERQIKILHGKGDGILKTMIRDFLKQQPEVKSFYAERVEFGGEGITIVELN